ncbi:hypothetical protein QFC20_005257 [Naganishia adeliensis]|uniref:Uncharacterized protein n=1 Tax=Naganishia adeliensis TaxID=92952 RepID=A0ACC2VQJ6_9TREE|nr:hypothetical protein QFC20_005257 [Naganishia adeliensis]
MSIPRIQSQSLDDSPSAESVLPNLVDHPAAVELDPSAPTLRDTLSVDSPQPKRLSAHRHRPHLHIRHGHRRSNDSTATSTATPRTNLSRKIPENGSQRPQQAQADANDDRVDVDVVSGKGYESPITPEPVPIPDVPDTPPPNRVSGKANGQIRSVWDEVRYEIDEKPGITPIYLTPLLTHLQSLTRSNALKLSTASRTIEHRVAEWGILSDRLQDLDREASEMGVSLVGKREWAVRLGETERAGGEEDADETPLKVLDQLVGATRKSSEALEALAQAVEARGNDVKRLKEKVDGDSVVLERRMGRGLERKMVSIERAQRDAKRRDLIINIVTFTVLFLLGIGISRIAFKFSMLVSTGEWSLALFWEWIGKWCGRVVWLVWRYAG